MTHISADDPPFLIIHGDQDQVVPMAQSEILAAELEAAGVPVTYQVVKNAGHGLSRAGGALGPGYEEIFVLVANFFDQHLK